MSFIPGNRMPTPCVPGWASGALGDVAVRGSHSLCAASDPQLRWPQGFSPPQNSSELFLRSPSCLSTTSSFLLLSFWSLVFSTTPSPIPTRIHEGFSFRGHQVLTPERSSPPGTMRDSKPALTARGTSSFSCSRFFLGGGGGRGSKTG